MKIFYIGVCAYDNIINFTFAMKRQASEYQQLSSKATDPEFLLIMKSLKPDSFSTPTQTRKAMTGEKLWDQIERAQGYAYRYMKIQNRIKSITGDTPRLN